MQLVFAAIAFLVVSCTSTESPPALSDLSSLALDFAATRGEHGIVVRSETSAAHPHDENLAATLEFHCSRDPHCNAPVGLQPSTIESFHAAQGHPEAISAPTRGDVTLLSPAEFEQRAKSMSSRPPDFAAPALIELSPAGFSSDGRQALVFFSELCGELCGGGFYLVFEKRDGKWSLTHTLLAWIS